MLFRSGATSAPALFPSPIWAELQRELKEEAALEPSSLHAGRVVYRKAESKRSGWKSIFVLVLVHVTGPTSSKAVSVRAAGAVHFGTETVAAIPVQQDQVAAAQAAFKWQRYHDTFFSTLASAWMNDKSTHSIAK